MASRAEARERMKAKWEDCNLIALRINEVLRTELTKNQVHDYLYTEIVQSGKLDLIKMQGDREAITQLIGTPGWIRMMEPERPRPKIHRPNDAEIKSPAEKVSLGMWFIKKIGDADEAVRVIKAAAAAVRSLTRGEEDE